MKITDAISTNIEVLPYTEQQKWWSAQGVRNIYIGGFSYFLGLDGFIEKAGAPITGVRVDDGWPVDEMLIIPWDITLDTSPQRVMNAFSRVLRESLTEMSLGAHMCGAD